MKCVILGNTNLGYSWFVKTFEQGLMLNGCDVYKIDYKSNKPIDIKIQLKTFKADYVFTHLNFHNIYTISEILGVFEEINKEFGTKFIHTLNDARVVDRYMGDISNAIYMAFVGNRACIEECRKSWKIPVFYTPYSSMTYENIGTPVNELKFQDMVFTGSPTAHQDRWIFIQKLQKRTSVKIFQTQSNNDLRHKTHSLSMSAKCILGLCTGYDIDGYIDVRPFQYLGAGAFMIIRKFKGMDNIIPSDIYIPFNGYTDNDADFIVSEFNKWKLKDTMPMRRSAFDFIQKYHSSRVRLKDILDVLEQKRDNVRSTLLDWSI